MWDSDVNPEGAYEHYSCSLTDNFKPFLTLAQFFVYENNSTRDAELFIYQTGFDWKISGNVWTLAAAYYDYVNLEDSQMIRDHGSNGNRTKTREHGEGFDSDF